MKSQGCGGAISHSQRMRPMFTLRDGSPSICLPKATALHKQMSMDLSRDGSPCICLPKAAALHQEMSMDLSRDGSPCSCLPKATALHQEMSMDLLRDVYPSICLPKATTLHQETRAVCGNQLISSRRCAEHLKQCCTQNSERLLRTPVDEEDGSRKIAGSREGAVPVD